MLAVVVVNLLTPMHYQRTDLGYLFVANFRYRLIHLICESLILLHFWRWEWLSAYTRDGSNASINVPIKDKDKDTAWTLSTVICAEDSRRVDSVDVKAGSAQEIISYRQNPSRELADIPHPRSGKRNAQSLKGDQWAAETTAVFKQQRLLQSHTVFESSV